MNAAQALTITRFVRAACPAQKFDEYTADVWAELLADLDFGDARSAVTELGKTHTFIGPPEIREHVKKIRADRIRRFGNSEPDYDGDDVKAGIEAIRRHRQAIADGRVEPSEPRPSIEGQSRVVAEIEGRCALPDDVRHAFTQAEQSAKRKRADQLARVEAAKADRRERVEAAQAELAGRSS